MASESSCAPNAGSEGSIGNMREIDLDWSPASPRSLSEAVPPYSTIGSYSPSVNSPARFPPPPNSGIPQTYNNINTTIFDCEPAPHHSLERPAPEPRSPYDNWTERSVNSVYGYGLDSISKFVANWPLPSAKYDDINKYCTIASEPLYPTIETSTQYPLSDSRDKAFVSRFPSSVQDYHSTISPSSAVPSTSPAPVSAPHFSTSSPQTPRPHFSSRFSFNPHASAFYPGMYSQIFYSPIEDCSPYYEPSYLSHLAPTDVLYDSHQRVDSFHDSSSHPVHSPETAPRPISSTAPSLFSGVHSFGGSSASFSAPVVAPQPVSSRTDYCGLTSSFGSSGIRETSCDFPPVSSMSFEMPVPRASVVTPYDTTASLPLSGELKNPEVEEDDLMERLAKESGTLLYHQHMSPEEWRWNIYEAQYGALNVEGLVDLADSTSRSYRSTYNYFQGLDRIGPNCVNEAVGGDSNSLFALSILDRSRFQNQSGPSLKLAASALAEMLAASSTGQSMLARIASFPPTTPSLPVDMTYPGIGDSVEPLQLPRFEKLPDDCCSSSGSVAVAKEANDTTRPGGPTADAPHGPHSWSIAIENERGSADCFPVDLAQPDVSGQSRNSTTARPLTTMLFNTVPQGGVTPGHPSFFSNALGGMSRQASASSTGHSGENVTAENPNLLFTQTLDVSPDTDSGTTRRVTTQPARAVSSEDDASVAGPLMPTLTKFDPSTSGQCHNVSSSRVESQVPLSACQSFNSPSGSVLTSNNPALSEAPVDPLLRSVPAVLNTADEVAAKLLASFSVLGPQTVNSEQTISIRYSGIKSLTTSILNVTNALRATHSSALQQSDIGPIQETMRSSILGLSECLLLEQANVNHQPAASNCVGPSGWKDFASHEQVRSDDLLGNLNVEFQSEAQDKRDRSHMKSSEGGPSEELPRRSNATAFGISGVNVGDKDTSLEEDGCQKTLVLGENVDYVVKHFQVGGSAKSGGSDSSTSSDPTSTLRLKKGEVNDILDYLKQQDLFNLPALKKLLAAEQREEKLKVLIQDLKEQLEFEREESRGAAFLYEKIMQEADVQTWKLQERLISSVSKKVGASEDTSSHCTTTSLPATVLRPAQPSTSGTRATANHLECEDDMSIGSECHRKAIWNEDTDNSISISCNKEGCNSVEIDRTSVKHPSIELEYSNLDGVETRLALLRGRHGRNVEEGPMETGSVILDSPGPSDWHRGNESVNGSSPRGLDGAVVTNTIPPCPPAQMLNQSDVLFNMDAAWNKGYHYRGSENEGIESSEVESKETHSHSVVHAYDRSLSIEARALIIRSRSRWVEKDREDSGDEMFAGVQDSGVLYGDSGISGFSNSEGSRFETVHDGSGTSLGVLLDPDIDHQQAVVRNTSPRPERGNEVECLLDSLSSDTEAVKDIIQSPESEEESGWEHVRLPRHGSK